MIYKFLMMFGSLQLSSSLIQLIMNFQSENSLIQNPLIWGVISPIFTRYALTFLEISIEKALASNSTNSSESSGFRRLLILSNILEEGKVIPGQIPQNKLQVLFLGLIAKHNLTCQSRTCICNHFLEKTDSLDHKKPSELHPLLFSYSYLYRREFFEEELQVNSKNKDWLKLAYASFILEAKVEDCSIALKILYSISNKSDNNMLSFLTEHLLQIVKHHLIHRNQAGGKTVDMIQYISYLIEAEAFKFEIQSVTKKVLKFWEIYQEHHVKLKEISELSNDINDQDERITNKWINLNKKSSNLLAREHILYAAYSRVIRNSEKVGHETLRSYEKIISKAKNDSVTDRITQNNLNDKSNIIVAINMNSDRLGSVVSATPNVVNYFGWRHNDLIGKNITTIMPGFLKDRHDGYLKAHLNDGKVGLLFDNRLSYGENKLGYLIPVYLYVTPHPNVHKLFHYVGILKPVEHPEGVILINENEDILGVTENLNRELGLNSQLCSKTKISDLCPDFKNVNYILNFMFLLKEKHLLKQDITLKEMNRVFALNEEEDYDKFKIPTTQKELEEMIEIYETLRSRGCFMEFMDVKNEYKIEYICRIKEETSLESQKLKVLTLKRMTTKTLISPLQKQISNPAQDNVDTKFDSSSSSKLLHCKTSFSSPEACHKLLAKEEDGFIDEILSQDSLTDVPSNRKILSEDLSKLREKLVKNEEDHANLEIQRLKSMSKDKQNTITDIDSSLRDSQNKFRTLLREIDNSSSGLGSISSSRSHQRRVAQEVKSAIQEKTHAKNVTIYFVCVLLYFLAASITFTIYNFSINSLMMETLKASKTMRVATLRTYSLLEMNRKVVYVYLVESGYLSRTRYAHIPDYSLFSLEEASSILKELSDLSMQFQISSQELDTELKVRLAKQVLLLPVRPEEDQLVLVAFSAIQELISSAIRLVNSPVILPSNEDMQFIMKNTLDDVLLRMEEISKIILDYILSINDQMKRTLIILTIVFAVFYALLMLAAILEEIRFSNIKSKFFRSFLRIDKKEYKMHVEQIIDFSSNFKVAKVLNQDMSSASSGINSIDAKTKLKTNMELAKGSGKLVVSGDYSGLYINSYKRVIIAFIVLVSVLGANLIFLTQVTGYNKDVSELNNRLILNDEMLSHFSLLFGTIYEYVGRNMTSKIRGNPVPAEFQNEFTYLHENSQFFMRFKDSKGELEPSIQTIIQGDLCEIFRDKLSTSFSTCISMAKGAATQGLATLNSYILDAMLTVKDNFDASDRSAAAIINSLNFEELKEAESVFRSVIKLAYLEIDTYIVDQIEASILAKKSSANVVNIALVIACTVMAFVGYFWLFKKANQERNDLKRILHLLPIKIILTNTHLKNYLQSTCDVFLSKY